ncbi:uncharacterized protein LOC123711741 [Pieris brassicae]|uniref:uncharacterized protein LOC123711741 n=1 Tax=Pieris brassicae TaxID=7116 RepID=UPI001E6619F9|nr:uncharacterized protein LOC123711741 [Pieris brassicae]
MKYIAFAFVFILQGLVVNSLRDSVEDTFEFGVNTGIVSFTTSGEIGLLEKHVEIPINLPRCMKLTYVRVDVVNLLGPPKVDLDSDGNIVIIQYRPLQFSKSRYTVVAKAIPSPFCSM